MVVSTPAVHVERTFFSGCTLKDTLQALIRALPIEKEKLLGHFYVNFSRLKCRLHRNKLESNEDASIVN